MLDHPGNGQDNRPLVRTGLLVERRIGGGTKPDVDVRKHRNNERFSGGRIERRAGRRVRAADVVDRARRRETDGECGASPLYRERGGERESNSAADAEDSVYFPHCGPRGRGRHCGARAREDRAERQVALLAERAQQLRACGCCERRDGEQQNDERFDVRHDTARAHEKNGGRSVRQHHGMTISVVVVTLGA